ncbi:MAG: lysophospholipid acyltransferase family protein [Mariprofundaceae bacterium]|nr:lysophospholipid acyltransferase family protein [Mariprofundaceae bacterium]
MLILRSALFNLCFSFITVSFSTLLVVSRPFGFPAAWFWGKAWSTSTIGLVRMICGVRLKVEGREHLPGIPCVVLAKHQSAFETIAMPSLVPPFVWVLKRELFYIPVFGWALWSLNEIAIRRANPREALKQVLKQGKHFLKEKRWVVIFPEGARTEPGQTGDYQASGIMLARKAGVGILPMAHNAGNCWPKRGFIKHPGAVRVRFLPYITPEEVINTPRNELLERLKTDIEVATRELGG